MVTLKRSLYRLILRLHPAAFRNRFAREMALDFEDALATFGFSRLLLDATRSLARQWAAPISFARGAAAAPVPLHPLLAGQYLDLDSNPLTPFELFRGSLLFLVLLCALNLALNARSDRVPNGHLPGLPANQADAFHRAQDNPFQPKASEAGLRAAIIAFGGNARSRPGSPAYYLLRTNSESEEWDLLHESPMKSLPETWVDFLLRCAIVSAVVWLTSFLVRRSRSIGIRAALVALGVIAVVPVSGALLPMYATPMHAQVLSQPSATSALAQGAESNPLLFDAMSIHQDQSSPGVGLFHSGVTRDGYHLKGVTVSTLIERGFVPSRGRSNFAFTRGTIIGAPNWLYSTPYDIDARVPDADLRAWNDPAQQPAMLRTMLQGMLANRFKLIVHRETKTIPTFGVTVEVLVIDHIDSPTSN